MPKCSTVNLAAPSCLAGMLGSWSMGSCGSPGKIPTCWGARLQAHREGKGGADYFPIHNRVFPNIVISFFSMEFFRTSASGKAAITGKTHTHKH